ncbi:Syntaxin-7 [Boothiomyces sp. JEL0866]|nr:Syntaxin-7 [Boothiomyces sp. JEL0866]
MSFAEFHGDQGIPLQDNAVNSGQLSNAIYNIASKITVIEEGINKYGTIQDSPELRHKITQLIEETKLLVKPTGNMLKQFVKDTDSKIVQKKMTNDFNQVVSKFQKVSRLAATKSREFVAIAKQQQQQQHQHEEVSEQAPLLQYDNSLDVQIEINENIIAEREQDLVGLERSILEVNEIFRDLGTLVNEQQFLLDNIETNVNNLNVNMENATGELRSAAQYQASAGKKMCWIFIILLVITLIAVLFTKPWSWGK